MKRTLRSPTEKSEMLSAWQASGLSRTCFARRHGVSPTSLRLWSEELQSPSPATTGFVEVDLVASTGAPALVVEVAGRGHRVVVPVGFDVGELRRLVAALC